MTRPFVTIEPEKEDSLRFLANTFSNTATFIGELCTNADRAGATEITIDVEAREGGNLDIRFEDNGEGVRDLVKLFTCHQSGWNSSVQEKRRPFGIGFYAALFACKRIAVTSVFGHVYGDTDRLMRCTKLEYAADDGDGHESGTIINMFDVPINLTELSRAVNTIASGLPIRITYCGSECDNSDSIEGGKKWVTGDSGALIENKPGGMQCIRAYLQGLPIEAEWNAHSYGSGFAVHLDGCDVNPRMPDRAHLINGDAFLTILMEDIKVQQKKMCLSLIIDDTEEALHKATMISIILINDDNPLLELNDISSNCLHMCETQPENEEYRVGCLPGDDVIFNCEEKEVLPPIRTNPQNIGLISIIFEIPYVRDYYDAWEDMGKCATTVMKLITEGKVITTTIDGIPVISADEIWIHYAGDKKKVNFACAWDNTLYVPKFYVGALADSGNKLTACVTTYNDDDMAEGGYADSLMAELQDDLIGLWMDTPADLIKYMLNQRPQPDLSGRQFLVTYKEDGKTKVNPIEPSIPESRFNFKDSI